MDPWGDPESLSCFWDSGVSFSCSQWILCFDSSDGICLGRNSISNPDSLVFDSVSGSRFFLFFPASGDDSASSACNCSDAVCNDTVFWYSNIQRGLERHIDRLSVCMVLFQSSFCLLAGRSVCAGIFPEWEALTGIPDSVQCHNRASHGISDSSSGSEHVHQLENPMY